MYYVLCAIWAMATLKSEYVKYKKNSKIWYLILKNVVYYI
jgi:hypothetical protein